MVSDAAFNGLILRMERFGNVPLALVAILKPILKEIQITRGKILLNEGELADRIWFVHSGIARENTTHSDTRREETTWLWFKGDFIFTTPGFFSQERSESSVHLLEDSTLIYISYKKYITLKNAFPEVGVLEEVIRRYYYQALKRYAMDLAGLSNQERCDKFFGKHPDILKSVNQKHITSFLGIRAPGLTRYLH